MELPKHFAMEISDSQFFSNGCTDDTWAKPTMSVMELLIHTTRVAIQVQLGLEMVMLPMRWHGVAKTLC